MDLAKLLVRSRGVDALTDPDVAHALQLTAEQKQRMRDARHQNAAIIKQCVRQWQQSDRARGTRVLLLTIQSAAHQQILCVLNAKQRLLFDRMRSSPPVGLCVEPEAADGQQPAECFSTRTARSQGKRAVRWGRT